MLQIHIGFSNNDKKNINITINSEYCSNRIYTKPFGANRMRYQYPDPFIYEKQDNILTIQKNTKDISKTCVQFFNKEGWNLDLYCSIIPNNKIWNLEEEIKNIIGIHYGFVKINKPIQSNYKFGILIPTFGRYEYIKRSFESLKNSNLIDTLLVIIDESCTKDYNDDKQKTKEFIENFEFDNVDVIKIFKYNHGNMFESLLTGSDLICSRCTYLMNLDSDTIHKKDWLERVFHVYQKGKSKYNLLLTTGYNSNNHTILEKKEDYLLKNSVGGCHLFFTSEDYLNYFRYTLISNKWDTNIYHQVHQNNGGIICVHPSVIEHIGEYSSVRHEKNSDKSLDYVLKL